MNKGAKTKSYKELTFTDDFIFCKVLSTNLKLCKELLELILGIKIKEVRLPDVQKSEKISYDGKGVRFDVYTEDEKKTVYDIEMQTTSQRDLPKRTRYYQGMIDLSLIEQGSKYSQLKKTYIIFICLSDPFNKGLPVYTFMNMCKEDNSLSLGDEAVKVIVNANGNREELSEELCSFLDFIKTGKTNSTFTRELSSAVRNAVENKEWEVEYMTMAMKIREERENAAIDATIKTCMYFNASDNDVVKKLMNDFDLTEEDAKIYIDEYNSLA